jgi:hypothetical protein
MSRWVSSSAGSEEEKIKKLTMNGLALAVVLSEALADEGANISSLSNVPGTKANVNE